MTMSDDDDRVMLDVDDWGVVLSAARNGDFKPAHEAREALRESRSKLLDKHRAAPPERREVWKEAIFESRATEQRLDEQIRAVRDEIATGQMHAAALASNDIAARAEKTAKSLRTLTGVLAISTLILAIATIVLVYATFQLVEKEKAPPTESSSESHAAP